MATNRKTGCAEDGEWTRVARITQSDSGQRAARALAATTLADLQARPSYRPD